MGLGRRLTIDADRPLRHQCGAVGTLAHETCAPQPFIQPLPIPVFLVSHRARLTVATPPMRRTVRWHEFGVPAHRPIPDAGAAARASPVPVVPARPAPGPAPEAPGSQGGAAPPAAGQP